MIVAMIRDLLCMLALAQQLATQPEDAAARGRAHAAPEAFPTAIGYLTSWALGAAEENAPNTKVSLATPAFRVGLDGESGTPIREAQSRRTELPQPPRWPDPFELKTARDGQRYVWIPAGYFTMGCSPGDAQCEGSETPAHEVTLTKGFWMGQTAVTVGAWTRMGMALPPEAKLLDRALNASWSDARQPIVNVTWGQAQGYCEAVGMRLPTEAEWEYAARAGTVGARYGGLDEIAWYADNSGDKKINSASIWAEDRARYRQRLKENGNGPHDVGTKRANPWKLYDMLGNVWQWVADWYGEKYYAPQDATDPTGPKAGTLKAQRGGSWLGTSSSVRVSGRGWGLPGDHDSDTGFRCAGE